MKMPLLGRVVRYFLGNSELGSRVLQVYSEDDAPIVDRFGTYPAWYPLWRIASSTRADLFGDGDCSFFDDRCPIGKIGEKVKHHYPQISDFDKSIYIETKTRLPNYILSRADRNSMANSVELRLPFLDNDVIDYALLVPNLFKMLGFKEKYVLRRAFKKVLPKHVVNRKKFGYNSPNNWLWNRPEEEVVNLLGREALIESGVFNPDTVTARTKKMSSKSLLPGTFEHEETMSQLTGVLSVQLLHQEFCR